MKFEHFYFSELTDNIVTKFSIDDASMPKPWLFAMAFNRTYLIVILIPFLLPSGSLTQILVVTRGIDIRFRFTGPLHLL